MGRVLAYSTKWYYHVCDNAFWYLDGSARPNPASSTSPAPATLARAGLATFYRIAAEWRLDAAQQMALLGADVAHDVLPLEEDSPASLPPDTLERLSHVFGIYKSLQILLPGPRPRKWIHRPNAAPLFEGRPALDLMLGGVAGLFLVRAYLDGERGGDFA